jgi:alkaline phosphatase
MVSHISARSCYGPDQTSTTCPEAALENGGLGSITEQLLDTRPDVTLGGGSATFAQNAKAGEWEGRTLTQQAQDRGYQMVSDKAGLAAITEADQDAPLLGLFAPGNLPVRWIGPAATAAGSKLPAEKCTDNPARPATQPTLAEMTTKAIDLLENRNGFFLQVEGASIDKQDHATNACGQIGETIAFDTAIGVALDYQKSHPDTLVVVTADHAHTSQIVADDASGSGLPTGYSTNLLTKDGSTLSLTYGTAGNGGPGAAPVAAPPSQQHTGAVVPVWARGPGGLAVLGTNDHTDLFKTLGG